MYTGNTDASDEHCDTVQVNDYFRTWKDWIVRRTYMKGLVKNHSSLSKKCGRVAFSRYQLTSGTSDMYRSLYIIIILLHVHIIMCSVIVDDMQHLNNQMSQQMKTWT